MVAKRDRTSSDLLLVITNRSPAHEVGQRCFERQRQVDAARRAGRSIAHLSLSPEPAIAPASGEPVFYADADPKLLKGSGLLEHLRQIEPPSIEVVAVFGCEDVVAMVMQLANLGFEIVILAEAMGAAGLDPERLALQTIIEHPRVRVVVGRG